MSMKRGMRQALSAFPVNRDWKPVAEYSLGIQVRGGSTLDQSRDREGGAVEPVVAAGDRSGPRIRKD